MGLSGAVGVDVAPGTGVDVAVAVGVTVAIGICGEVGVELGGGVAVDMGVGTDIPVGEGDGVGVLTATELADKIGIAVGIAKRKGIKLRWGGDWDRDGELSDNRFNDLGHLEIDTVEPF